MAGLLAGKVALVTGGGSGIGRASTLGFAREGAHVVVADVDSEGGAETVRQVTAAGGTARFVRADVSQAAEVDRLVSGIVEAEGRLDCAHNNAGIVGARVPTADYPEEVWDQLMSINLKGVWLCMKAEIRQMLAQGGGVIVNTASVAGLDGFPGHVAYSASKHGVLGLTKTAAREYARAGIRINAVCPGFIQTPMLDRSVEGNAKLAAQIAHAAPLGRVGTPEEVAAAVIWLCTPATTYITGHGLVIDGGILT